MSERSRGITETPIHKQEGVGKKRGASAFKKALIVSAGLHIAGGMGGRTPRSPAHEQETAPTVTQKETRPKAERLREELFERAKLEREEGRLSMGRFLLEANAIEVREERREEVDVEALQRDYEGLLTALRARLPGEHHTANVILRALAEVLHDYDYMHYGGQYLSDLLEERSGSCEQISHLVASLLYDYGYTDNTYLRVYPPDETGVGHVAPIMVFLDEQGVITSELDAVSATPAFRHGSLVRFDQLIDFYRDAHDPHMARAASPSAGSDQQGHATFAYPDAPPEERVPFPSGAIPYFHHGILGSYRTDARGRPISRTEQAEARPRERARFREMARFPLMDIATAASFIRERSIQRITDVESTDTSDVEIAPLPSLTAEQLEILSDHIERMERQAHAARNPMRQAVAYGVLVGLYRVAAEGTESLHRQAIRHALDKQADAIRRGSALVHTLTPEMWPAGAREERLTVLFDSPGSLAFLGEEGARLAVNILAIGDGTSLRNYALADMLQVPEGRIIALEQIRRLPVQDQMGVASALYGSAYAGTNPYDPDRLYRRSSPMMQVTTTPVGRTTGGRDRSASVAEPPPSVIEWLGQDRLSRRMNQMARLAARLMYYQLPQTAAPSNDMAHVPPMVLQPLATSLAMIASEIPDDPEWQNEAKNVFIFSLVSRFGSVAPPARWHEIEEWMRGQPDTQEYRHIRGYLTQRMHPPRSQ